MHKFISRNAVIMYLTMVVMPIGYIPAALADGNGYLALFPSANSQTLLSSTGSSLYTTMASHGPCHSSHQSTQSSSESEQQRVTKKSGYASTNSNPVRLQCSLLSLRKILNLDRRVLNSDTCLIL
jgi:hypothetical protein